MSKIKHDPDSQALQEVITALMAAYGVGGLSRMAERLGMTPSNLRKRLRSRQGAFDAVTMRAVLMVTSSKAQVGDRTPEQHGNYLVGMVDGKPKWRRKQ